MIIPFVKLGIAAGAVLLGTASVMVLTSDDAKKFYTKVTAAALRAKDAVKDVAADAARSCSEIIDDAVAYNAERAAARDDEIVEEAWEEDAESEIVEETEASEEDDAPADDMPEDSENDKADET